MDVLQVLLLLKEGFCFFVATATDEVTESGLLHFIIMRFVGVRICYLLAVLTVFDDQHCEAFSEVGLVNHGFFHLSGPHQERAGDYYKHAQDEGCPVD